MENEGTIATTKVILFTLDNETYGVPIDQVLSIERIQSVTRVPNAAPFVEGVMNLRGLVIPVINVRRRFLMQPSELTKESRIIIVEVDSVQVGLLVDAAKEVLDLETDKIERTPEIVGGLKADYISGVCGIDADHLLILLDLKHVLNDKEMDDLKSIEGV
ncbi:MAG: chemotaxis protein CheW [Sporolactobacillus sp.]